MLRRFAEAQHELDSLMADEQVAQAPVLILGNKIDMPGAAGEDELRYILGLQVSFVLSFSAGCNSFLSSC